MRPTALLVALSLVLVTACASAKGQAGPEDEVLESFGERSKVLGRGTGAGTRAGQLVVTRYESRVWGGGDASDSTWAVGRHKAFRIGKGRVMVGWDRPLVGIPVGSRVLMIAPPGFGYENGWPPSVKPGDALVFVFVVLADY